MKSEKPTAAQNIKKLPEGINNIITILCLMFRGKLAQRRLVHIARAAVWIMMSNYHFVCGITILVFSKSSNLMPVRM